jgi:hypothetical protein
MTTSTLPPVELKTQVIRTETGSMNTRNTQNGVML